MKQQLRAAIQQMLSLVGTSAPGFLSRAVSSKLYEIYLFSLVVRALDMIGATFTVMDSTGAPSSRLRFRLNGGRIYSPYATSGFILTDYDGREFEIHNGVRVSGASGIIHELDVSLIDHRRAEQCRQARRDPSARDVGLLIECKFYGGDLNLELGREFVGLCKEFTVKLRSLSSNEGSDTVKKLIKKHGGAENFHLSPLNPTYVDDRFVPWLAEQLRQSL